MKERIRRSAATVRQRTDQSARYSYPATLGRRPRLQVEMNMDDDHSWTGS